MSTPKRIQLSRAKGWRKPPGAIVVARPTKWGNPFDWRYPVISDEPRTPEREGREQAVESYRQWLLGTPAGRDIAGAARRELRGADLCCWCPPGSACHASVLLEIANA